MIYNLPRGLKISIQTIGMSELIKDLQDSKSRAEDFRPAWNESANIVRHAFDTTFRMGGRPRWKPLSQGTLEGKYFDPNVKYSNKFNKRRITRLQQLRASYSLMYGASRRNILIASGALRDSYVQKNKDHVERISKERLIIGSKHTIAPFHEFGTGVEGPKQRAFLIQAKNAKALKFMGPRGVVFAKSVMNPGVPKRPVTNLPDEEIDKVVEVLTRYFYEGKSK